MSLCICSVLILLGGILSMEVQKYRIMIDKSMCIVHIVSMDLFIFHMCAIG